MTVYSTENLINCRGLDGYETPFGVTKPGRAIRCGIPKAPTENDLRILRSLGIKTVIDLRGPAEAKAMPSFFAGSDEFDYVNIPLLEANPSLVGKPFSMAELYISSLRENRGNYADVMHLIASLTHPFLFHCFLGKDRTGILSAILLSCAGAAREDIYRNYECTYELIKPFAEKEIRERTGLIWEKDVTRLKSDRVNLIKTFEFFDSEFGGVTGYLQEIGIIGSEISSIRDMLTK